MSNKKPILVEPAVLMDYLQALDDPRIDRTKKHELIDILIIAICAAICGAKTWIDIEDFGKSKRDWFFNIFKSQECDSLSRYFSKIIYDSEL